MARVVGGHVRIAVATAVAVEVADEPAGHLAEQPRQAAAIGRVRSTSDHELAGQAPVTYLLAELELSGFSCQQRLLNLTVT